MSETSSLTGPILKALDKMGILAFRMQSGQIPIGRRWIHLCKPGTADILCFPFLRRFQQTATMWIETNDPNGTTQKKRKEDQAEFAERVRALGHIYLRAESLDDVLEAIKREAKNIR
jgi:hypothetical protein